MLLCSEKGRFRNGYKREYLKAIELSIQGLSRKLGGHEVVVEQILRAGEASNFIRRGKHTLSRTGGVLRVMGRSEEIRLGQLAIRFLLEGEASGGSVAAFEFDIPAGAGVPAAHSHEGYQETIYGLEGVLTWTLDGRRTEVGPGEVLFIPRGVVHRFDNEHGVDAKMLAIVTPGVLGPDYFREMAAVIEAASGGPPDSAALAEVMRRHGLTPAP